MSKHTEQDELVDLNYRRARIDRFNLNDISIYVYRTDEMLAKRYRWELWHKSSLILSGYTLFKYRAKYYSDNALGALWKEERRVHKWTSKK